RHVGAVSDPIQHPVADYADPDGNRAWPVTRNQMVNEGKDGRPNHQHQQTVRPRIVFEVEWIEARVSGNDTDAFPSQPQEWWAEAVGQQRSGQEHCQRGARRELLGSEAYGKVPNEHSVSHHSDAQKYSNSS